VMRSGTALTAVLHAPPSGWDKETFERVTDALGAALVATVEGVPRLEPRGEKDGAGVYPSPVTPARRPAPPPLVQPLIPRADTEGVRPGRGRTTRTAAE
jgi:hypothetical protein